MTPNERAWIVREHLAGRTQTAIADELGMSITSVCVAIREFCDEWSGADARQAMAHDAERRKYALRALERYFLDTGQKGDRPQNSVKKAQDLSRHEHAWLLRAEGMTYRQIAERLGLSIGRSREMVLVFGRRVTKATSRARIHLVGAA